MLSDGLIKRALASAPNIKIQVRRALARGKLDCRQVDIKIKRGLRRVVRKLEKIEKVVLQEDLLLVVLEPADQNKNPSL